jgi:hypothetical protein
MVPIIDPSRGASSRIVFRAQSASKSLPASH